MCVYRFHLELFWMDLCMQNPLDAEVNLTNVTLVITESGSTASESPDDIEVDDYVEVEVIKNVILGPKASTSVSCMKPL